MLVLEGDLWTYECQEELPAGSQVKVIGHRGGVLLVERIAEGG